MRAHCRLLLPLLLVPLADSRPALAQRLPLDGPPRVTLGVLDQPSEEVFGRIVDAGLGPRGDVFVLDGMARELRWFSEDGEPVAVAGGEGHGPGELAAPFALAVDSAGLVHVLDARNQRISVFEPDRGRLRLRREVARVIGLDLCISGSRRYLLTYASLAEGDMIREIGADGEVLRSFARPSPSDRLVSGSAKDRLHAGLLACGGPEALFLVSEIRPSVRAFHPDGAELWRSTLADYRGSRFEEGPVEGSVRRVPEGSDEYVHTAVAATVIGDHLYITLHAGSLRDPEGSLELRILRVGDGVEVSRHASPVRVVAGDGERVLGHTRYPFSRLFVY